MCPRAGFSLASIELEEWKNEIVFFLKSNRKKIYIYFGKSESEEIMVTHVGRHFG